MSRKRRRRSGGEIGDLRVLAVSSEGDVLVGLPGGGAIALHMPRDLAPFYRRLIPDAGDTPSTDES